MVAFTPFKEYGKAIAPLPSDIETMIGKFFNN